MLNPQQLAAVQHIDGPLLVLAGAGSGKTSVITQKIAHLIQKAGYPAYKIYAVTFTNKAANEMQARVAALLPNHLRKGLKISTFHTLGLSLIKQNHDLCDLKSGFSIFDSEDSKKLLKSLSGVSKSNEKEYINQLQHIISNWKNALLTPKDVRQELINTPVLEEAYRIYPHYQQALKAYNAVDFDDLIFIPVSLLRNNSNVREHWENKIRYLLVDEYQDSNLSQYELIKLLTGPRAAFTVVGDDDQSIYAWRGAKPENLGQLQIDYPQLRLIKLEQNYRSTGLILHVANHLIAHNPHLFEKKLWSSLGRGEILRVLLCKDENAEAEQVVADLISNKLRKGTRYGDYAILYRGNHQSRIFEKILRQHGIAYQISGGQSWFSRTEVKDIFSYIKLLCNEQDNAAFLRIINTPKRGIGESSLDSLSQYAHSIQQSLYHCADHFALTEFLAEKPRMVLKEFKKWVETFKCRMNQRESIPQILKDMIEESSYEAYLYEESTSPLQAQKRMENVWELVEWINRLLSKEEEASLHDVINKLILIDILEQTPEQDKDTIQLMTLHASKGLEFPFVYLIGMEEDLLPHRVSIDEDKIEEERRLTYVGITRAQQGLCFSLAKVRRKAGEWVECQPSRFLDELPKESLEWFGKNTEKNEVKSKALAASHLASLKSLLE